MRHYESTAVIDARPEAVWAVLTDAPAYAEWDSGVVRVEGRIAPQEKIKVVSRPTRSAFGSVTSSAASGWSGAAACRSAFATLTPENGSTRFAMREEYTGPMLPLIWRSMPDLQPSFEQFARGLKARAERA